MLWKLILTASIIYISHIRLWHHHRVVTKNSLLALSQFLSLQCLPRGGSRTVSSSDLSCWLIWFLKKRIELSVAWATGIMYNCLTHLLACRLNLEHTRGRCQVCDFHAWHTVGGDLISSTLVQLTGAKALCGLSSSHPVHSLSPVFSL